MGHIIEIMDRGYYNLFIQTFLCYRPTRVELVIALYLLGCGLIILINCPNCAKSLKINIGEDLSAIGKDCHRTYDRQHRHV